MEGTQGVIPPMEFDKCLVACISHCVSCPGLYPEYLTLCPPPFPNLWHLPICPWILALQGYTFRVLLNMQALQTNCFQEWPALKFPSCPLVTYC